MILKVHVCDVTSCRVFFLSSSNDDRLNKGLQLEGVNERR